MRINHSLLVTIFGLGLTAGIAPIASAQKYTEFPVPSTPANITSGPDGALWFTDTNNSTIGRIATSGAVTMFPTPSPKSGPRYITTGPDGAMWFTEYNVSKIARIPTTATPSAPQFSEFNVPDHPVGIATGPDGDLWFSMNGTIGRMTVDGKVINQIVNFGAAGRVTIGPDHSLWTAGGGPFICKMTAEGLVTTFRTPADILIVGHADITAGPDGALWFTEYRPTPGGTHSGPGGSSGVGAIGRFTTDGKLSYPFTVPDVSMSGITLGPDGALWFTECCIGHPNTGTTEGNKIGRVTADGKVHEFYISSSSAPGGITTGPDGALWFTEAPLHKIGRFQP